MEEFTNDDAEAHTRLYDWVSSVMTYLSLIRQPLFTPARACPVLVNGHVICVFSRFNVDGDQF